MTIASGNEPLILRIEDRIGRGAYADVFSLLERRVAKLFRRKPHDPNGIAVAAVCRAEMDAFDRAHANDELSRHTAAYFGPHPVDRVIEYDGGDVSDRYWCVNCYVLEYLAGRARKIAQVPAAVRSSVDHLLAQFEAAGIAYTEDASVFGWESAVALKLVDIATHDAAAAYPQGLFGPNAP